MSRLKRAEVVRGAVVTTDFKCSGPARGREFIVGEDVPAVRRGVVGHGFWQSGSAGDRTIEPTIGVTGRPRQIGIAPAYSRGCANLAPLRNVIRPRRIACSGHRALAGSDLDAAARKCGCCPAGWKKRSHTNTSTLAAVATLQEQTTAARLALLMLLEPSDGV
jgi:hypothetical protein